MNNAQELLEQSMMFYETLGQRGEQRDTCQLVLPFLDRLRQFATGESVKRCRDKHLEEAVQLLTRVSKGLWEFDGNNLAPLVRSVIMCQMETTSSSSSFHRLEKIVAKLSEVNPSLVSEQVNRSMRSLAKGKEPMPSGTLQTVCMFIEESRLGRCYWKNHLISLLGHIATTFDLGQQGPAGRDEELHCNAVKVCLQLFKWMPEDISPLVWDETEKSASLQRILGCLLQTIVEKAASKDTRLLAGTAVSLLVNTAPDPQKGASAVVSLYLSLNPGGYSVTQEKHARKDGLKGECEFGRLCVPTSSWSPDGLEILVLTRGLLASCRNEILSCQLDDVPEQACLLLDVLFPAAVALMEEPQDCHYYCFQVFSMWLQRIRDNLKEIWEVKGSRILADNSSLLRRLTHFIWNNAESPVEGVSSFIHSSFRLLLEIYSLECDHFSDPKRPLYGQFLQRIILMPWQSRARYFPLISILPFLGPEKVLETYRDLPQHLVNCLSTNHLCPAASDLYKTTLQLQRKSWTTGQGSILEEDLAQKWATCWLTALSRALTSPVFFVQNNASNYLLGWTLGVFPASYTLLAESFSGKDPSQLRAWVALLNAQRTITGALPAGGEVLEKLSSCLFSEEDNIRLAALGLLCSTPKTNQALSEMEIRLLKDFLPLNLNCDASSFRQLLQASVKKALVRLRDSSLAALREVASSRKERSAGTDPGTLVEQAIDFVEWLLQLSLSSLTSGSNYQRKKTALLLLMAIMDTCTDTWRQGRKKGQPPRNMATLLNLARSKGCWDFFSRRNTLTLLSCLQDSTNEIRELASELLVQHFPPTFPESIAEALFKQALSAVNSPRVPDVESGAVLLKTILQKSDWHTLEQILPEGKDDPAGPGLYLTFLNYLLGLLRGHFAEASHDLLQAARTTPMHGVISALRRCLLEVPEVAASMLEPQQEQRWRLFLSALVSTVKDIGSLLLGALQSKESSSTDQQAAAPSYADMGNAIGCLVQLGKGLDLPDGDGSVLLSEEHSLILTCCWVSVKEIGLLLGGLAEMILPLVPPERCDLLLPFHVTNAAAEIFQEILLKCRHWGAVEGCSMGFAKFCSTLLTHRDPQLQDIPSKILNQGLALLEGPRCCSITRRAAGFPMLFLCIVTGEDPAKPRRLLAKCIQTLLTLANRPFPRDWDQTVDLPQVSAIHVLQTLLRGSGLGTALHQYVTSLVSLFLKALSSPSWAMRNAAIQLFGALTVRLLGQKQSRDDHLEQAGVSATSLFGCYPQLRSILLRELTMAAGQGTQRGKFHLYPSLYAILTFLAKLQPSTDSQNRDTLDFLEPLFQLSRNPIYAVRLMAARALVPLVPVMDYSKVLLQLASGLPHPDDAISHNALHGRLLQIHAVLTRALHVNCLPPNVLFAVTQQFKGHTWLLISTQQCPLVLTAYLQVVSLLVGSGCQDVAQHVYEAVNMQPFSSKPLVDAGVSQLQIGSAVFCQHAVFFLCGEAARLGCPKRIREVCSLLQRGNDDTQKAILTWLVERQERNSLSSSKEFQQMLLGKLDELLKRKTNNMLLKLYLEAFVHLCSSLSAWNPSFSHKLLGAVHAQSRETLLSMVENEKLSPAFLGHALCALAFLLTPSTEDHPLLERWSKVLQRCSDPVSSEVLRLAAAKAMGTAGVDIIWTAQESSSSSLHTLALRLISAAICLLQDEDQQVRREASVFASLLVQRQHLLSGTPSSGGCVLLQSNKGLVSLLEFLLDRFGDLPEAFALLMYHLPKMDLAEALSELESTGSISLYKDDEPNVFAEPAVFSQTLLPFLLQLLNRASTSPKHLESAQAWLKANGPGVISSLQHALAWWSPEDAISLHLKAVACPKVNITMTTLLAKAALAAHIMENLDIENHTSAEENLHVTSQELRSKWLSVQTLLAQRGMVPLISWER